MEPTEPPPVVSDAGPIIHLDELGCLDLLSDFDPLFLPQEVWREVVGHRKDFGRAGLPTACVEDVDPGPALPLQTLARSLGLHVGEMAALALAQARSARLFLTDDAAARLAAESLAIEVHGTVGILVRAIRRGQRTRDEILCLLRDLPRLSSLHISASLLAAVIAAVEHRGGKP